MTHGVYLAHIHSIAIVLISCFYRVRYFFTRGNFPLAKATSYFQRNRVVMFLGVYFGFVNLILTLDSAKRYHFSIVYPYIAPKIL